MEAIAVGIFTSQDVRDWLVRGTPVELQYTGAGVFVDEQRAVRWKTKATRQPFWANYFCGRDDRCTCRISGSRSLESDAIFFLANGSGRVLAAHIEFKQRNEPFQFGQPEGYPLRAACFVKTQRKRRALNTHDDWTTVLFCDEKTLSDSRISNFHRVITHAEAERMIENYPKT